MNVKRILISSIFVMLIFFEFITPVQANIFSNDDDKTDIEKTIEKDERRII